jgi:hypothetical protein
MIPARPVLAVADATLRDLRRRTGVLLAALAVAVLLIVLPDLCARAVDEAPRLSLQAGISTITLFLVAVAGFSALRAGAGDGDLAAAAEWRAAPLSPAAYVVGRFAGILAAAAVFLVALSLFLLRSQIPVLREAVPDASVVVLTLAGMILTAALFASLGLLLAVSTSPQLAAVLFVATAAGSWIVVPAIAARGGPAGSIALLLPDPARLDFSQQFAFSRPLSGGSAALACAAAAVQTAAFLVLAAWRLRTRET